MTILNIPARTAWGEARGQGSVAMQAVLCVIRNRVIAGGWWGDTYDGVCQKPYQFSCWNAGNPNLSLLEAVTDADPQFAEALRLEAEMLANTLPDITFGADSYYAIHSPEPSWARQYRRTAVIGGQAFYQTRALTTPNVALRMMTTAAAAPAPTFRDRATAWAVQPTTWGGALLAGAGAAAGGFRAVHWVEAVVPISAGIAFMIAGVNRAMEKPLQALFRDLLIAAVTKKVDLALLQGDIEALEPFLVGPGSAVPPPPNDPFPPAPVPAAAPSAEPAPLPAPAAAAPAPALTPAS